MITFPKVKDKNKVLLVFPKLHPHENAETMLLWTPISMAALTTHLLRKNFEVEIYDSRTRDDFEAVLAACKDDLLCVGVSTMAGYQVVEGYNFSKYIKENYPHIPVIWGGWFPTISPDHCLTSPFIDLVVKGQGEEILPEIALQIKNLEPVNDTTGISYREHGEIIHNERRPLKDLSDLLPIDYSVLDVSKYSIREGIIHYVSSVGCPYDCAFCGVSTHVKRRWYPLSPERVVREIKGLAEQYNLKEVIFYDSTLFVNQNRVKEILKGFLREKLQFRWMANSHINQVAKYDDEMLDLLQKTNCYCIEVGIESGSSRIREMFRKNFSEEEIATAIKKLANTGIELRGNYIIAPPREERGDFMQTIRSMRALKEANPKNIVMMYQYTPIPGTDLAKMEEQSDFPSNIANWSGYYKKLFARNITKPWLADLDGYGRQPILFYVKSAYDLDKYRGMKVYFMKIFQALARFRLKHEIFMLPFEWHFFRMVRAFLVGRGKIS